MTTTIASRDFTNYSYWPFSKNNSYRFKPKKINKSDYENVRKEKFAMWSKTNNSFFENYLEKLLNDKALANKNSIVKFETFTYNGEQKELINPVICKRDYASDVVMLENEELALYVYEDDEKSARTAMLEYLSSLYENYVVASEDELSNDARRYRDKLLKYYGNV